VAERHLLCSLRIDRNIVVHCRCGWCGVYDGDGALHHDMRGRYEDHARIAGGGPCRTSAMRSRSSCSDSRRRVIALSRQARHAPRKVG
jgi:hypothetical protein